MKRNKGITLIALVITIIVLLILAGVAISMLSGDNGILKKAVDSKEKYSDATDEENKTLGRLEKLFEENKKYNLKTVKGSYINIDNAYSDESEMEVYLTSDSVIDFSTTEVCRYNSNLWDISQMLQDNTTDNGDGTYTFKLLENTDVGRFSNYCNVNIPAGVPFFMKIDIVDNTFSGNFFVEINYDEGEPEYLSIKDDVISGKRDKTITKIRFMVVFAQNTVGQYIKFKNPKINIDGEKAYEKYANVKKAKANAEGKVIGLTSLPKNITIISNNMNAVINCKYKQELSKYDLFGKTIVNLGDSIFGNYQAPIDISTYLSNYTGANVYNLGFGGTRMGGHLEYWNDFSIYSLADAIVKKDFTAQENAIKNCDELPAVYSSKLEMLKNIDFNKVDIITINSGTNDFTGSNPADNQQNKYSVWTYGGALRKSIETFSKAYPNLKIVICTPTYRVWYNASGEVEHESNTYEINSVKLTDMVQTGKNIAEEYNLLAIDNYYELGIDQTNAKQFLADGVHPNLEGRKKIAEFIAKKLYEKFH